MKQEKKTFMENFQEAMEKYVVPIGMKISDQRHMAAIREGMTVMITRSEPHT